MTIQEFIEENNLHMYRSTAYDNPDMVDGKWKKTASHYSIKIERRNGYGVAEGTMALFYSQGSAIKRLPTLSDVLDCLASDSSGFDNAHSFEEWAGDYGYDTDSRTAEKTYKQIEKQAGQLRSLLGDEAYEQLINDIDRL